MDYTTVKLECERPVRSLAWRGDTLVDWVGGGTAYGLDGSVIGRAVRYAYRFDASVASPDGRYAVIHERLGTKGLLLRNGEVLRELNRSFYCASVYAFPVCLWQTASGRTLLAHCPNEYNVLQLEDADTGEVLAAADLEQSDDFFHSRLQASPSGARLLSAGWLWHPWDAVVFFDLARAIEDPQHLSSAADGPLGDSDSEASSATWLTDHAAVVATSHAKSLVAAVDVRRGRLLSSAELERPAGTMMAVGERHIVALHGHPRLIRLCDGEVLHEWTDLHGGVQLSSIMHHHASPPPMALDPVRRRFAVSDGERIHVVSLAAID
jgi:hypothetical protein